MQRFEYFMQVNELSRSLSFLMVLRLFYLKKIKSKFNKYKHSHAANLQNFTTLSSQYSNALNKNKQNNY